MGCLACGMGLSYGRVNSVLHAEHGRHSTRRGCQTVKLWLQLMGVKLVPYTSCRTCGREAHAGVSR